VTVALTGIAHFRGTNRNRLGLGETDTEKKEFPAMSMREAIGAFTEAAYGESLTFESP
jgi:hypothetical protein